MTNEYGNPEPLEDSDEPQPLDRGSMSGEEIFSPSFYICQSGISEGEGDEAI